MKTAENIAFGLKLITPGDPEVKDLNYAKIEYGVKFFIKRRLN